ncbi:MAG: HAD family phosphatase [Treponema sp.]|nr:HAD family phosphatase [Treponema sp.]
MIKAVIFDMDGVILDSETICVKCWEKAGMEYNLPDGGVIINQCFGTNKKDSAEIIRKHYGENFPAERFLQRTSELFHEVEEKTGVPLMPFAKDCLEKLKAIPNLKIGLATSTRRETMERQLRQAGVIEYFEAIVTGDMVEHSKPNPDIYLLACKTLGVEPKDCIAVEDSPNGIRSAFAAGMLPVMVPDKIQPDEEMKKLSWKIIKSLKDLEIILAA